MRAQRLGIGWRLLCKFSFIGFSGQLLGFALSSAVLWTVDIFEISLLRIQMARDEGRLVRAGLKLAKSLRRGELWAPFLNDPKSS